MTQSGRVSVMPYVGYGFLGELPGTSAELESDVAFGGRASYQFSPQWAVFGNFQRTTPQVTGSPGAGIEVDQGEIGKGYQLTKEQVIPISDEELRAALSAIADTANHAAVEALDFRDLARVVSYRAWYAEGERIEVERLNALERQRIDVGRAQDGVRVHHVEELPPHVVGVVVADAGKRWLDAL